MKKLIAVIVVLGIGAGTYPLWSNLQRSKSTATTPTRQTTATVAPRNIKFVVNVAGDIGPADQVSVRPEITGRIAELSVDVGDEVVQGKLLCRLDDRDLQTERSARVTDIDGARLSLEKTQRAYERSRELFSNKLIPQETFEDARTDYDLARNTLEKSQKALSQVEDQILKTRIVAPFDCTVLTRPVSMGQAVSGSGGNNGGTEIITIANLKNMIINSHVNQADVARMKPGQPVDVEVEAVPGLKMTGVVLRIAPQATLKNGIKGFATQIELQNIDPRVRPGMTANVAVPLHSADNVLAVPLAAVFTEQGERYVYVKKDNDEFEARPIQIGVADFQYTEVLDGLAAGEVVSLVRPETAPTLTRSGKKSARQSQGTNTIASVSAPGSLTSTTNLPGR